MPVGKKGAKVGAGVQQRAGRATGYGEHGWMERSRVPVLRRRREEEGWLVLAPAH